MGKTRRADKAKHGQKGAKGKDQKQHQADSAFSHGPCSHCKSIATDAVQALLENPLFRKAVSGKRLTRSEVKSLSSRHRSVAWSHPDDFLLCLICGEVVDARQFARHSKSNHFLSLSIDEQIIHCDKCDKDFEVLPGTLCGQLLGVEAVESPEAVRLPAAQVRDAPTGITRGLINLGNSCWLNSIVQVLATLPTFCDESDGPLSRTFSKLAADLRRGGRPLDPLGFVNEVQRKLDWLSVDNQEDANEFLVLLLDQIRDEQRGSSAGLSSTEKNAVLECLSTLTDTVFAFVQKTTTQCEECRFESELYQRMSVTSLFIPIGGGATTLEDCLRLYFSSSGVDGEDRICDHCHRQSDCQMTYSFETFPRILCLHLTRFRLKGDHYVKNNVRVAFPELLSFDEILQIPVMYRLAGFVSHYGTMEGGHYTAIARIGEFYFEFDDRETDPADPDKLFGLQPYVLFYQRIEDAAPPEAELEPDEEEQ
jgi:ubiquitin C-terminal hydrolase